MWDVAAGVELAELPPSGNWNFAAAWSPTNPGVFATASFDGKARSCLVSCTSEERLCGKPRIIETTWLMRTVCRRGVRAASTSTFHEVHFQTALTTCGPS